MSLTTEKRTEELKESLRTWRHVLLPLNNLIEWEHKYDPLIIFGIISCIFGLILQLNPSVLTLFSCIVLLVVLIDLLAPMSIGIIFRNENWTPAQEEKYTRLCAHISHVKEHVKHQCDSVLKVRKERPTMYLIVGGILLVFIAFCGQRYDNLLLTYLTTLILCLIPGMRSRQIITIIRQHINDFRNSKKSTD